jgi:hypothetical protein
MDGPMMNAEQNEREPRQEFRKKFCMDWGDHCGAGYFGGVHTKAADQGRVARPWSVEPMNWAAQRTNIFNARYDRCVRLAFRRYKSAIVKITCGENGLIIANNRELH